MEDKLSYIARLLSISREKASELTGLANDAVAEVLDPEHIQDHSPERESELETEEDQVNLNSIAEKLHFPVTELHTWTEDELIFISLGRNVAEGFAAEGPTCLSATANFFCRWYDQMIVQQQGVLLSDGLHHRYDMTGEVTL